METMVTGFSSTMSKPQRIAGYIYLPLHIFIFPIALGILAFSFQRVLDETAYNIVYYGLGFVFCFTAMLRYMRRAFDVLLDNPGKVIVSLVSSYFVCWLLSYLISFILIGIMGESALSNPNDEAISDLVRTTGIGPVVGIAVFLAPVVEEVLFRGVLFGSIHRKSRFWAYVISIALFGVYHVWQYALVGFSWTLILSVIQYIPIGFAMARCYERTNCIWAPIFLHMINNAFALLLY